ncbi:dynamin family protein [Streptomyces sp. UNOC14_S4]|uniref:dynamin family protein n=1 Tax=Streptomyces sp. UNOC14_S4 TaxID=2872340 RepID=UPI001E41CD3E|nr:dynamin family protein [Streptomyces sp. UNOC14_S4]MCC3771123.1 dynamin family protein [Streptomyces sp. UNOC14_S4]
MHGVLGSLRLPPEHHDALWSGLLAIQARADDPELRVAVFGEASSGKSTLLNALLRRRLLPSSARVTTRTTTVLRYRRGAEGLRLRTADGTVLSWPSEPFARWAGHPYLCWPSGLDEALRQVLTTELAGHIRDLEVRTPVRLLGGGVAMLDTPGFSVTDRGHRELAEAAVRHADLALVVVPAVAAMSMTLVDFLTGPLRDHHERCAFVLTKIDLIDHDERAETVKVVEDRIKELGIEDPVLLPCAPGKALEELVGPAAHGPVHGLRPRPGRPEYLPGFLTVEARISRLAADSRQSATAATVLGSLSQLLGTLEEAAAAQRAEFSRVEHRLAALSPPDFPAFLNAWAQRVMDRAGPELWHAAVEAGEPSSSLGRLDAAVTAAVAGDRIDDIRAATAEVSRIVRIHLRTEAEQATRAAADRARRLLAAEAESLARDFAARYGTPTGAAGWTPAILVAPPAAVLGLPTPDLSGVDRALTAVGAHLTTCGTWRTGGSAVTGAVLGTAVFPGIGTVIGGALGAFIGKRDPDTARDQFLRTVRPVIATAHEEIGRFVAEFLLRVSQGVRDSVTALREKYDHEFGEEVARIAAAHYRQRAELATGIAAAEQAAAIARHRREQVAALYHREPGTAPHDGAPGPVPCIRGAVEPWTRTPTPGPPTAPDRRPPYHRPPPRRSP